METKISFETDFYSKHLKNKNHLAIQSKQVKTD